MKEAEAIYLNLCVRLRQAATDEDQETADRVWALTDMLEWAYPGTKNRVREAHGLPAIDPAKGEE